LFLKGENGEIEKTIDLGKYSTTEIHQLLIDNGLERNAAGAKDASRDVRDILNAVKKSNFQG
jgi:hypothetical protein